MNNLSNTAKKLDKVLEIAHIVFGALAIACIVGVALIAVAYILKLDPANYFVSFVPVDINVPMVLAADAVSFAVIMLLLLVPTLFISKVDPARTVRMK